MQDADGECLELNAMTSEVLRDLTYLPQHETYCSVGILIRGKLYYFQNSYKHD